MLKEFKQFVMRGNVVDLAVAVVIGVAFGAVVTALVTDLITPLVAAIFGKPSFAGLSFDDQQEHVPLRRLHQRRRVVPGRRGGDLLPGGEASERARGPTGCPRAQAAPTTRECPECLSEIPIAARRCAYCTSAVPAARGVRPVRPL